MLVTNNERNKSTKRNADTDEIDCLCVKDMEALAGLFIIIKSLFNVKILKELMTKYQLIQFDEHFTLVNY